MEKIKGMFLDVENMTYDVKEVEKTEGCECWYNLLNCSCIDIQERKFGNKYHDIVIDDEGKFKEGWRVGGVSKDRRETLAGNLFICNCDYNSGELVSLTDEEIEELRGFAGITIEDIGDDKTAVRPVVMDYEY